MPFKLIVAQHVYNLALHRLVCVWKIQSESIFLGIEFWLNLPISREDAVCNKAAPNLASSFLPNWPFLTIYNFYHFDERLYRNFSKRDTAILFVFCLELAGKIVIALIGDDEKLVD